MRAFVATGWIMIALLILPAMALADWSDNFDSYANDSQIVGQGGWEEWGPGAGGFVRDDQARSAPHSLEVMAASDVVHQYTGYTTGKWFYETYHYVPSSMTGITYFILLNTYAYPSGPYSWSVQMGFDTSTCYADCGSSNQVVMPYKSGRWNHILAYIDLDEDWVQVYLDGQLLDDPALPDHPTLGGGYAWSMGVFGQGGGVVNIAACDLFANSATAAYFDDMSLAPATIWADVRINGDNNPADITVGQNAKMSIAFVAGDEYQNAGDVFVALTTPLAGQFSKLTYDGVGGIGGTGWHPGLTYELVSGPLGNYFDLPLDWTMGNAMIGDFRAYLAADGIANGLPDIGSILVIDFVDFTVIPQ